MYISLLMILFDMLQVPPKVRALPLIHSKINCIIIYWF